MFYADTLGLARVLAVIEKYRLRHGEQYWTPAPILERLANAGRRLADQTDSDPALPLTADNVANRL